MKKAVLDIGSNSIKFMLADMRPGEEPRILEDRSDTTRLAEGLEASCALGERPMRETIDLCLKYVEMARSRDARRILAFATSAVRDARNRAEFESAFKLKVGVDLVVLTERQEAALVFAGATSDGGFPQGESVVMDVGGGSAEWIAGNQGKVLYHASAPMGCVRMTERFLKGDPYTEESFQNLVKHLETEIRKIKKRFSLAHRLLIATGGSACALAAFDGGIDKKDPEVHGRILEIDRVDAFVTHLRSLAQKEREKLPGIPPSRADVITAGATTFAVALHVLGAEAMQVSVRGLRFGAILV